MQNFDYQTPTRLIFGKGVVEQLPEVMEQFGKKILLTYGGGSIKKIGLYDKVKELLSLSLLALRDLTVTKKYKNATLCFFTSYEETREIGARHSLKKLLDLTDAIMNGLDAFAVNASVPAVLTSIIASCN